MTNQKIFCNTPWYELQIYWDGSLGICCQEAHKLYPDSETQYNIATMSIAEWINSEPVRKFRLAVAGDTSVSACRRCYTEETYSGTSRRHRSNQKSVIFTRTAFNESYQQSPSYDRFEYSLNNQGYDPGMPIDLHIDLGNYCNLTCKMCNPRASSSIAAQYVKWGMTDASQYIGSDWTRNEEVWQRTLKEIAGIKKLHNVHFMGGETLITRRFEDFVDYMIEYGRTDLHFSFVTNGTTFNQSLLDKLKKFQRVGIEVSIESLMSHNAYQRQGTDTQLVLSNLERYLEQCNGSSVTLTARPAISALTIGSYWTLLEYCYNKKIIVKNLLVNNPQFLDVRVLPDQVRADYIKRYKRLEQTLDLEDVDPGNDYNESDPNQLAKIIKNQINQCINLLVSPRLPDILLTDMVQWCRRWDLVHGYNAIDLYPELAEEFINRGY